MAFTPQYQIGTPEYSQELAAYLNSLSPEELIALGEDFNVAGLARSDLSSISPWAEGSSPSWRFTKAENLAYTPEQLKVLSKYRNIEGTRSGAYGTAPPKIIDQGDMSGDRRRQMPVNLWATRNQPGTKEPLYQYTDNGFEVLPYNPEDSGFIEQALETAYAPLLGLAMGAGLTGLIAAPGAAAGAAGAGSATGYGGYSGLGIGNPASYGGAAAGASGAGAGLAGAGSGVGAGSLMSGGNFSLLGGTGASGLGAGSAAASPLAGYSLLGGTGAAELGATIGAGGFGATNLMGGAGAAGATGGGMGFTDWLKSGLTDFSVKDALSIGGDLFGGYMANAAASDASDAALGLQRDIYNQTRADYAPYRELGEDAVPLMRGYLGLDDMEAPPLSPLAKWEMQQGNQALGRAESARGISTGGGAASRATDLTTKVAGNDWMRQYGMILDTLNVGRGATTGGSSAANQYAANSGNILMNQGQQDASFWQGLGGLPRAYQNLGIQRDMAQQGSPFVNNQQPQQQQPMMPSYAPSAYI